MKRKILVMICSLLLCMAAFFGFGHDADARIIYTTNDKTNAVAEKIIKRCTNDKMTQEQKLKAVYEYLVRNMRYSWSTGRTRIKVTKKEIAQTKALGKKLKVARSREFKNRFKNVATLQGTCYGQNKVFCILANHLGYTAHMVHGTHVTAAGHSDHYWCYLYIKGKKRYFDVQAANRTYKHNKHSKELKVLYMGSKKSRYWRKHYQ